MRAASTLQHREVRAGSVPHHLALPGFSKDDIKIVLDHNRLFIRGKMKDRNGSTYLHRGIAGRGFERQFDLADYIEVTGATMGDGVLVIDLKRELPEALHASLTVSMAEAAAKPSSITRFRDTGR